MKFNRKHAIIAAVVGTAISITGIKYKEHVNFWELAESCSDAREARRNAGRLLGKTIMSGMGDLSGEVTMLIQDANDIIAQCNQQGI